MPALHSAGPADGDINQFGLSPNGYSDPFHQATDDLLALLGASTRRIPKARDVHGQGLDPLPLLSAQFARPFDEETIVLLLKSALAFEGLLPSPFQLSRHQPVLWFNDMVLASGAIGFNARRSRRCCQC